MPIYEMTSNRLEALPTTTFAAAQVRERDDLQRLLRDQVCVIAEDVLLVAEEFGQFDRANRRIDLLGVDSTGRLVVIELKRTEDAGHSELQAIRYAAMVSAMTFDQLVDQRERFVVERGLDEPDSRAVLRAWVGGEEALADDVRIILVAADFGIELTTSVLWLSARHDLDIRCVRVKPYALDGRLLLDVQQVIPLPETADYQVGVRRKEAEAREASAAGVRDMSQYQLLVNGTALPPESKQATVKRAVALLVAEGVPLADVRNAVGRRWRSVEAATAHDIVREEFLDANGMTSGWWPDAPYEDQDTPGLWWVMARVGGSKETEPVLERLEALRPGFLGWRRAEPS